MDKVIERIAHFADIDTRRAMGFKPRKLVTLPELKIWIPRQHPIFPYIIRVNFDNPEIRIHRWVDAPYNYNAVFWVFKNADYVYKTSEFEWSI